MFNIYSQTNIHEIELMILALKTMLNNINLFPAIEDRIFISSIAPSVIQKLAQKKPLENNELIILATALTFVHNVFTDHETVKANDKVKIQPYKSIYEKLYKQYKLFNALE